MRCQGLSRNISASVAAPMANAVQLAAPPSSASPTVGPDQRRREIEMRQRHVRKRYRVF